MSKHTLDSEEKALLESFDRGEWRPVKNKAAEITRLQKIARNTLTKNKRINIRLAERDLVGIQTRAVEEGMPYQTLISSILHKYLSGRFIERKTA
jgi:predicted DNA binding CopG/RHH family protein